MRNMIRGSFLAMMLAVVACDSSTRTPTGVDASQPVASGGSSGGSSLNFLVSQPSSPTFTANPVSFWAVQGQDRRAEITYASSNSGNLTQRLLLIRIRQKTQITRPDGTPLAVGDSILITMTVVDASKLIVQFEPSGLRFGGKDPATLTMSYAFTDHDFNHDGVINAADLAIENSLTIYRQESSTAPWNRVQSTLSTDIDEVTAVIPGFTNYVIAY